MPKTYPTTPDGRYFEVRGRLWRTSRPDLAPEHRQQLVHDLMDARRAVKAARASGDAKDMRQARHDVDATKIALGERGPVWWNDGAPDYNRHMARNTPYADWFAARLTKVEQRLEGRAQQGRPLDVNTKSR